MRLSNKGIATQIAVVIVALLCFGVLYVMLDKGVQIMTTFQQTNFGSGVFNPVDYLTFVESTWTFWPFFILLVAIFWLIEQSRRRSNPALEVPD
jgi:hypothetical protein